MRCTSCWLLISRLKTATGFFLIHRDMLGDVHGEGGFSHARPAGDDDHFRRDAIRWSFDRVR